MASSRRYVLDANALIGFFEGRTGAQKVRHLLGEAHHSDASLLMSAVNWGEVYYVTWQQHGERMARVVQTEVGQLPIAILAADRDRATRAAAIKQQHHLAYADSFAAEIAIDRNAWLVTSDPEFLKLGKLVKLVTLPKHEK